MHDMHTHLVLADVVVELVELDAGVAVECGRRCGAREAVGRRVHQRGRVVGRRVAARAAQQHTQLCLFGHTLIAACQQVKRFCALLISFCVLANPTCMLLQHQAAACRPSLPGACNPAPFSSIRVIGAAAHMRM